MTTGIDKNKSRAKVGSVSAGGEKKDVRGILTVKKPSIIAGSQH